MAGYVNQDHSGWTELRVHGVSGTPPQSMLQHLDIQQVSGDARAGFFRRRWDSRATSADTSAERLEAYSWGSLTAGSGQRALWLLLLPFMLVNVAYFAVPQATNKRTTRWRRGTNAAMEAVQRLFALSITISLVLSSISVSMDLVGWQCVRPTWNCGQRYSWLRFLTWHWLDEPGRRLVVTALVPLAVVAGLWALANKTWINFESVAPPAAPATSQATPLEDRRMWNGMMPVRRLRSVHVTAGFAVIALLLTAPLYLAHRDGAFWVLVSALLLIAATAVLACLPSTGRRLRPVNDAPVPGLNRTAIRTPILDYFVVLPPLALLITVAAGVLAWLDGATLPNNAAGQPLPWFGDTVVVLLVCQVALLVLMFFLILIRRPWAGRGSPVKAGANGTAVSTSVRPAWFGFAAPAFMWLALLLTAGFSAGLGLRTAALLGKAVPATGEVRQFVVPSGYFWGAGLAVAFAAGALLLAGSFWLSLRRAVRRGVPGELPQRYPREPLAVAFEAPREEANRETVRRARAIARIWADATVTTAARRHGGIFVAFTVVVAGAGIVAFLADDQWIVKHAHWVVNVGTLLVGGFVVGMFYVGLQAYRNPRFRRTVGVLWDLGTFWPRATHPLAPPCYAERAVPDLIRRIEYLGCAADRGRVVLSCHSQGSVIGAAVVMQLTYAESKRVALITYGCPLRRLYSAFFPAYFGVDALLRAGGFLVGCDDGASQGKRPEVRSEWPWRNLYRPSDPIGDAVFVQYSSSYPPPDPPAYLPDNGDVDRSLVDPPFARRAGDTCYPAALGHSDYFADPAYRQSISVVRRLRR
jgi:hypothetical protein